MMSARQERLHSFFSEKAKHLQNEIDWEIEKVGGEGMLISREDLIHWVYHARSQVETYRTVCRMLESRADGEDTLRILQELRDTVETDRAEIARIRERYVQEKEALSHLKMEAAYYRMALEELAYGNCEK